MTRSSIFPRFPRFPGCSKSIFPTRSSGLFSVTRSSIFPRFPGWLFGPSQHPPGNPGKRGNGGSDLRGIEALGAAARTVPSVVAPSAQRSAEHLGRTFGRTFRQLTPPAPVVVRSSSPRLCPHRCPHCCPHRYPHPSSWIRSEGLGRCSDCEGLGRCSDCEGLSARLPRL